MLFTAPTSYRAMAAQARQSRSRRRLRKCVSAGEALPAATRKLWKDATGIEIIDGIGATEMLHIFISHDEAHARPGATGTPVPGYRACVMDDDGQAAAAGQGRQARGQGPDRLPLPRRRAAARITSRTAGTTPATRISIDDDGYFVYQARTDDMIISAGYNIAGPEVEGALLLHPAVAECGVVGVPDDERGQIVKAFVVLKPGTRRRRGDGARAAGLRQARDRAVQVPARRSSSSPSLPRTETGKLQRFRLRQRARTTAGLSPRRAGATAFGTGIRDAGAR